NIMDQYPFGPQKAALIEIVANSLDAKASCIQITLNKDKGTLEVLDDGCGMDKTEFKKYHDFAGTSKDRGSGIGFAGQGAKLALNFCKEVLTETWSVSPRYQGYSRWWLKKGKAPYEIHDNELLTLKDIGTKVTLYLKDKNVYSEELIKDLLLEHYFPLLNPNLREEKIYRELYKDGVKVLLNGEEVITPPEYTLEDGKNIKIVYKKKEAYGIFWRVKSECAYPGVMICTYGKVIKRTSFNKEPRGKEKIIGWIEAPWLIEAVTTDKCRFQEGNKAWSNFSRKAQKEFSKWLEEIGLLEKPEKKGYISLEKEINSILKHIPELSFFGSTTQREVPIPDKNGMEREVKEGVQRVSGDKGGDTTGEGVPIHPGDEPGEAPSDQLGDGRPATLTRRTVRGGVGITEVDRPDLNDKEAWFDGETVSINKSHSAYAKAKNKGLLNYHILKVIVLSLIEYSVGKGPEFPYQKIFELQEKFFRLWGEKG
ncbi:MAG: ATP-binding protein, partial [Acidobacteria bacterium]|nr:ATP-binding protein [Acidobacteriota bacterium]